MSQNPPPMIRPNQIDGLPILDAATKAQYKTGLQSLWDVYENSPEGSEKKQQAGDKIKTASTKLMSQLAQARNRPASGNGPRPGQAGNMMQGQQQMNQISPQQQQLAQAQAQAQAQARAQAAAGQGGQANPQPPRVQLSTQAQQEFDNVKLVRPANVSPQQFDAWKLKWRNEAFSMLARRDAIVGKARQLNAHIKQAKDNGQEPSPEAIKQFEEAKKAVDSANTRWRQWRANGEGTSQPNAQPQQRPGTQGGGVNPAAQQSQQQPQNQQPDSKPVTTEQPGASLSPAQPQAGFQQNPLQSTPAQQTPQQNIPQQGQTAQPQQNQTPQSATMPQPPQNFPQQQNMQQQRPPQINTQQTPNAGPMSAQQGAPQAVPPSAGQVNPQRPQPLSHSQAMAQASANYPQNQQGQQQQQPQMPNGLPFSNQPQSTTQQNTPTSQYPHLQTTQTSSVNTRFPIPKTLALDPRTQTAVAGPASRPTLNNQGMMYTPGVARAPPYVLEGEGDRVLSKRKLDELVRQVTGAAPSSDNSESSSVLTPEVEESILQVADDFVDSVITSACKLAKLRPNQTLDIRDVQMVLERNYGIRIPGYSLDEVRTVRKFQPAPGWHSKMQAVQAGKVMGSRDA